VWKDAVGCTRVHKITPVITAVHHVDQEPGGDGVEPPRAA